MANNDKNWSALEMVIEPEGAEALEFALNELDAQGTEINNLGPKQAAQLTVVGYFNELPTEDEVRDAIADSLEIHGLPSSTVHSVSRREVQDQDWLAEWKKNWKPTETGSFIVAPAWQDVSVEDKIVIRIEPSMAFGTGTHETTRLCLRAIEENLAPGESFLDVGTGTGILAIAAAKLQTSEPFPPIYGCDTDEDSIKIAKENVEINGVDGITLEVGPLKDDAPVYDFVCANLTADVIVPILPLLISKTKRMLVMSGILAEQKEWVTGELEKLGIKDSKIEQDGEWISVTVGRPPDGR